MVDKLEAYAPKPDCAVCGQPYHRHNIGSLTTCPIIASYRPKKATPANGEQVERAEDVALNMQKRFGEMPEQALIAYNQACRDVAERLATLSTPTEDARSRVKGRPFSEWHEDHGNVLWWKLPIMEPPYCGSPLDLGRGMKVTVQIGFEEHEMPIAHTGGWPFSEDDEPDLWWSPLPSPTFFHTALGNKETDRHG